MTQARGFTLIEIMVVVAIVAILAAIAMPSYNRYTFRSRRVDGKNLLLSVANAQERYYATYNRYGSLTAIGFANPAPSGNGYYNVTVVIPAGSSSQSYTATAQPQNTQSTDACGALTVNSTGVKTPLPASTASNANGSCW